MSLQTSLKERKIIRHGGPYRKERIKFPKTGRTKQSFKDECDMNLIVAKHAKTGALTHLNKSRAEYGFASGEDFSTAMRTVTIAQEMFDGLPSSIRTRFANSPQNFLDFVQDADNLEEGAKLGIWKTPPAPAPEEPEITPPTPDMVEKSEPDPEKG